MAENSKIEVGHVMIDIETLGKTPGSQILSIGAVLFYDLARIDHPREWIISSSSSRNAGFTTDPDTLEWWSRQAPSARKLLEDVESDSATSLARALVDLAGIVADGRHLWCKGVGFDFPILAEAYRRCGWGKAPWHYRQERCYRTLAAMRPDITPGANPDAHGAAADALHQARHAATILNALAGGISDGHAWQETPR